MRVIQDLIIPNPEDEEHPRVAPLLGNVKGLPPHLIFVAGQDRLRDEGIAYG